MSDNRSLPPSLDEIEVSVFGPGKGECVAVHLGGGDWIVVDSCVDQQTREVPVLDYLGLLKVNVSDRVKLVVASHAHDDHIAGLARVFEACQTASFVCSSALTREEFLRDVRADEQIEKQIRKTIRAEYRLIFEAVKRRPVGARLKYALQERCLFEREGSISAPSASVTALSPSDEAVERAYAALSEIARERQVRRLAKGDPNELAVALRISVGDISVVLGSDLINGPAGCGWQAVVETFEPEPRASLFKVPHHGSPNAHYEPFWDGFVSDRAVSVLAPYRAGRTPRPQPSDIDRLKTRSRAVFSSANPRPPALSKAARRTSASLSSVASNVRIEGRSGHVRARCRVGSPAWAVDVYPPALEL